MKLTTKFSGNKFREKYTGEVSDFVELEKSSDYEEQQLIPHLEEKNPKTLNLKTFERGNEIQKEKEKTIKR